MPATRTKTIEYMLPMLSTAAAYQNEGTTYLDSADTTIFIPETTDRVFRSVTMEVTVHDNMSTLSPDLSGFGVRASCDAGVTWTTATVASGYADSGENMSHIFVVNMTAEFTARFTGTSDTLRWGFYVDYSATGPTLANAAAKVIITYAYDDAFHTTRIKTVRIPIESLNGRLSNTSQEVKQTSTVANQLPALIHASTHFLPESGVTIRQAFCELWTNSQPSTTTDCSLSVKIDSGGSETTFGLVENGNSSPLWIRFLYNVTSVDWTSAHALFARHDVSTQSYFSHLGGWLTVTYEYNETTSTTILNSIVLGFANGTLNVKASGDDDAYSLKQIITEPTTITLVQSGVFVTFMNGGTSGTFNYKVGSQTATGYTPTGGTTQAGMTSFMHRIDSGGHRGVGITLNRGENTFTCEWFASTANLMGNVSSLMFLN